MANTNYTQTLCNHTSSDLGRNIGVSEAYLSLTAVMAILSIGGSTIIIKIILTVPGLKTPGRMFLLYLSCSDLLLALANFSSVIWWLAVTQGDIHRIHLVQTLTYAGHATCTAQAAITSTASLASFFWTSIIALNIYLSVVKQNNCLTTSYRYLPHILCWGVPLCIFTVTLANDRYGLDPCTGEMLWWCWISRHDDETKEPVIIWQLITGKIWEIMSYIFVGILYIVVVKDISSYVKRVKTRSQSTANSNTTAFITANRKLIFVPLVFIVARIWGTLRFFLDLGTSSEMQMAATVFAPMQGLGDSAQGFLNCLVFIVTTPSIRERLPCRKLKIMFRASQSGITPNVVHNDLRSTSSNVITDTRDQYGKSDNYGTVKSSHVTGNNVEATDTND